MDSYTKFMGKTVEDAVQEACIELGTTAENLEYRVIVHETKGFLGFGAKQAVIEAKMKRSDDDLFEELMKEGKGEKKNKNRQDKDRSYAKGGKDPARSEKKAGKEEEKSAKKSGKEEGKAAKKEGKEEEKSAKKPEKKETKPAKKPESNKEKEEREPKEKAAAPLATEGEYAGEEEKKREKTPRVPADPAVAAQRAVDFLSQTFAAMGIEVTIDTTFEEDTLSIDLSGDDMGILIGKRGQTLDSLQYLTSLVVNKGKASYVRVKLDTENYRERRKATLENLAKNIAFKVKKTRRPVYLEPMNPYERRIIHSALQSDPYVTTHSEGEEPARRVVVTLKKRDYDSYEDEEE